MLYFVVDDDESRSPCRFVLLTPYQRSTPDRYLVISSFQVRHTPLLVYYEFALYM